MSDFSPLERPVKITEQVWPDEALPVLSIFNWVYNHREFIRESIESILNQKTTFPVEIIIHDDASSDGTNEIILEYQEKYPFLFKNILHKENQWSQGKSVMVPLFEVPRGNYIALAHGDDYWTDPLKLQKQVDFLDGNPEFGLLHTDADQHNTITGEIVRGYHKHVGNYHTEKNVFDEIIKSNYSIFTCTVLFRRELLNSFSFSEVRAFDVTDTFLWLEFARKSKFKCLPETTAVRQLLVESATQSRDWNKKLQFKKSGYELMKYFINKYDVCNETTYIAHNKFNRVLLYYSFRSKDQIEAKEAFQRLSGYTRINMVDRVLYWGSQKQYRQVLTLLILKLLK